MEVDGQRPAYQRQDISIKKKKSLHVFPTLVRGGASLDFLLAFDDELFLALLEEPMVSGEGSWSASGADLETSPADVPEVSSPLLLMTKGVEFSIKSTPQFLPLNIYAACGQGSDN